MENRFSWGDPIIIKESAPHPFRPGKTAFVSGFYQITSPEFAKKFQCDIGEWVYTVEFQNGGDLQVAECYLRDGKENSRN